MNEKVTESWIVEIRRRLAEPPPRSWSSPGGRRAAVLVPMYVDAGELWILFTQRSDEGPHHRGQVAFPGGAVESAGEPWDAVLRSAQESIGLEPGRVLRLGVLDAVASPSGFEVVPCVGAVPFPLTSEKKGPGIISCFALPVSAVANPRMREQRRLIIQDEPREITVSYVGRHQIWGLTEAVVEGLLARIAG